MTYNRNTLAIVAVAAALMLISGGAVLAQEEPAAEFGEELSSSEESRESAPAVQLQRQREAGTRIIDAPMCFLPRFTENEQDRCSLVGWIVRKVSTGL